jgi:uncharacterized protein (TIGR02271 family)
MSRKTPPSSAKQGDRVNEIISLAREELAVGKRTVETGRVRVTKQVKSREERVVEHLSHDEIDVERVYVNRPVDGPIGVRQDGDVLVIPVIEEVLVVKKQLFLREELRVRKRSVVRPHRERVVLRSEEASVERQDTDETRPRPHSSRNVQPKPKGEK